MKAIGLPDLRPIKTGWTAKIATARAPLARGADRRFSWAQVAQLVEHVTENHGVGGSIPPLGTINGDAGVQ